MSNTTFNKFNVLTYRFHTYDKNILFISGWFQENFIGESKLCAKLDDKDLEVRIEEKDVIRGALYTNNGLLVTKQYFLWINLPDNWENYNKLTLLCANNNLNKKVFTVNTGKLVNIKDDIEHFVDRTTVTNEGFNVNGWCVTSKQDLRILDNKHNAIDAELSFKKRVDVLDIIPEAQDADIVGFNFKYEGNIKFNEVFIEFPNDNANQYEKVYLNPNKIQKLSIAYSKYTKKIKVHLQQYGIKQTVIKCINKLTEQDVITYQRWCKKHNPTKKDLEQQKNTKFEYQPKISIVVPLYKTPENYLKELIESFINQTYSNWELCLSDGSGENSPITNLLNSYTSVDTRIKVNYPGYAMHISENTNNALSIATGDYIAFADHDDLIPANALYEIVKAVNDDKTRDFIYTDEDKVSMDGSEAFMPHFKSDFNIDLLRSNNYICHLVVVKKDIIDKVGGLDSAYDGAQDYDFVLRATEAAKNIYHIPKILYHWRAHKNSTAENPASKDYAFDAGVRAIQAHYNRVGINATVERSNYDGAYRTHYHLESNPLVSVIIANKDHIDDLEKCLKSLDEVNDYDNVEYIIVENNSTNEETFKYYNKLPQTHPKAKVVKWDGKGFNYSAINNYGVLHSNGEYVLLLNNDIEFKYPGTLQEMLGYAMRADVGAVGAKLYYPDGTIQHAGVIIGLGGVAGHAFYGFNGDDPGYFCRANLVQDLSAVTAACILVKRKVYDEVNGLDEIYTVAFNDIDLCLKIRKAGYKIVFTPHAELIHYESKSRGKEDTDEKVERFQGEMRRFHGKWFEILQNGDPYYNINLTVDRQDFSLAK